MAAAPRVGGWVGGWVRGGVECEEERKLGRGGERREARVCAWARAREDVVGWHGGGDGGAGVGPCACARARATPSLFGHTRMKKKCTAPTFPEWSPTSVLRRPDWA